tara:strand:+ start:181 stop:426 length:246 start_codon:yes stop_codon:yes gene_type:complete
MFYGSSTWSEVPFSTFTVEEANGEELNQVLLIDTNFYVNLPLQVDRDMNLFISQNDNFSVDISRELELVVNIDSNQTWSLS